MSDKNKTYKITCNNLNTDNVFKHGFIYFQFTNSFCKRFNCAKKFLLYSSDMHHLDNKSANLFSEEGIYVALI